MHISYTKQAANAVRYAAKKAKGNVCQSDGNIHGKEKECLALCMQQI